MANLRVALIREETALPWETSEPALSSASPETDAPFQWNLRLVSHASS